MTTHDDILTCIADGRLAIERTVAFSMACTLAKVEAMVRELQPTAETTERGNTAEIQELEEMRQALDDADYAPTVAGLRDALGEAERAVRVWKEQDEALRAERDALRAEVAALTRTTALLRVAAILAAAVAILLGTVTGVAVGTYVIGLMVLVCCGPLIAGGVWGVFRRDADLE